MNIYKVYTANGRVITFESPEEMPNYKPDGSVTVGKVLWINLSHVESIVVENKEVKDK